MKTLFSFVSNLIKDLRAIVTSRQRLSATLRVPLYSNSLFLILNSVITYLLSFVFWIIAARFYSTEQVGIASAILSSIGLMATISMLGLNHSLIKFMSDPGEKPENLINSTYSIGLLSSLAAAVIYILGCGLWSPELAFIRSDWIYFTAFIIFAAMTTLNNLFNSTFVGKRRAGFTLGGSIVSLSRICIIVPFSIILPTTGIIASWGLPMFLLMVVTLWLFLPRLQPGYRPRFVIKRKVVKSISRFAFGNYASNILWSGLVLVLPVMVINVLGAEQNAYFYIAWTIGNALISIPTAISLSLFAEGSYDEAKMRNHLIRSLKFTLVLLIPSILILFFIGGSLLKLYGQAYSENGTRLLWVMVISALPASVNMIYLSVQRVREKLTGLVVLPGFIMAATLSLSYFMLPRAGIIGAGYAWLIAQSCAAVFVAAGWVRGMLSASR